MKHQAKELKLHQPYWWHGIIIYPAYKKTRGKRTTIRYTREGIPNDFGNHLSVPATQEFELARRTK